MKSTGRHQAVPPERGCNLVSGNTTLKKWHPEKESLDDLLDLPAVDKVKKYDTPLFSVRVAYQIPINITFNDEEKTAFATTFEVSLVFENLPLFKELDGDGMVKHFKAAINDYSEPTALGAAMFAIL